MAEEWQHRLCRRHSREIAVVVEQDFALAPRLNPYLYKGL